MLKRTPGERLGLIQRSQCSNCNYSRMNSPSFAVALNCGMGSSSLLPTEIRSMSENHVSAEVMIYVETRLSQSF